jgi:N-dimethylarginine dimethylaminohydrolase
MTIPTEEPNRVSCFSEYDPLRKVLVCEPRHMSIDEIINETQKHYADENIDKELAVKQHTAFVQSMRDHGIEVIPLPHVEEFPEQVFTRDIGFALGRQLFVSHMGRGIRQGEDNVLIRWLERNHYSFHNLQQNSIEGGDVMVDQDTVYVGISGRTSKQAIHQLAALLPNCQVVAIPIDRSYLHLDCVFNVLSPTEALLFSPALHRDDLDRLSRRYELIEVPKSEQFKMGTNVLSIGNKKLFSLPVNEQVNQDLRSRGYDVIEVDFSEVIKSGGSFRCCTLPLIRGNILVRGLAQRT